jgi:hypothetical protein
MYSNIKEKLKKLFKHETKIEHYEKFLLKIEMKKMKLKNNKDEESKESLKILNKLIEKLKKSMLKM